MNAAKQQYLSHIRSNTAYPAYRGIVGVMKVVGYIIAGLTSLVGIISGSVIMGQNNMAAQGLIILIVTQIYAAIIFLGTKFFTEAAVVITDMSDSITDANSRNYTEQ